LFQDLPCIIPNYQVLSDVCLIFRFWNETSYRQWERSGPSTCRPSSFIQTALCPTSVQDIIHTNLYSPAWVRSPLDHSP